MANILENNNVLLKIKEELIDVVAEIEEIKYYLIVQEKMQQNEKIIDLIAEKKQLQKELVNIKAINKEQQKKVLETKMETIEVTLEAIPLYQQYLYAMEDAQKVLDELTEIIQEELAIESDEETKY